MVAPNTSSTTNIVQVLTTTDVSGVPSATLQASGQTVGTLLSTTQYAAVVASGAATATSAAAIAALVSGGGIAVTAAALLALRRAGTLTAGATYALPEGFRYYANSTSNFWPLPGAPILTGPTTGVGGDSFAANGLFTGRSTTLAEHGWANTQVPVPLEIVSNRGVAGTGYSAFLSVQVPLLLADACEIVWVQSSRNIWLAVAASSTLEQAITDLRACLDALTPYKQLVIVDGSTSGLLSNADRATEVPQLNARIAAECARYPNVIFNDVYPAMVDPAGTNGDVLVAATYDGILHPNTKGAMRMGVLSAKNLAPKMRILPRWSAVALTGAPTFTGTGGTTSGTGTFAGVSAPNNIVVANSAGTQITTLALKSTTGSAGSRLNVAMSANSGTASRVDISLTAAAISAYVAQLSAGDTIRAWVGFRLKSSTLYTGLIAALTVTGGGGTTTFAMAVPSSEPSAAAESPFTGRIPIGPVVLGAGFTSVQITLAVTLGATTGAIDFDVWDFSIEKLTAA